MLAWAGYIKQSRVIRMYTTIEADIENGLIKSSDIKELPSSAHVLITLLRTPLKRRPDWDVISSQIGKLRLREDTVEWQRRVRSEWS